MKILLIGSNGQLGVDLHRVFRDRGSDVIPMTHRDCDVRDADAVSKAIQNAKPDAVVNTAAFHNVQECENQPGISFEVNAVGIRNVAQACNRSGCILIHFSTDYVFDGKKHAPYSEDDLPRPLNVYGVSKLAGELLIAACHERYFVIRTCGLYGIAGSRGKGGNFVENIIKKARDGSPIRVVDDQVLTPTTTVALAQAVVPLVESCHFGLYHATCEGECSWYAFTKRIFEFENLTVDLKPVATSQPPGSVKRPTYSVLSKNRLQSLGIQMPHWTDALERYLTARR